jgi:hypothetical protein
MRRRPTENDRGSALFRHRLPTSVTIQLGTVFISNLTHHFATMGRSSSDDMLVEEVTLVPGTIAITSGGTTVACDQIRNNATEPEESRI